MRTLKQFFCTHWFDPQPMRDYEYSSGPIVCGDQRSFRATIEPRICSKCGLSEERRIAEPEYLGWN